MWRSVDGYINYQVSNVGRVRNANTVFLKQRVNNRSYLTVRLQVDNKSRTKMVHRLVANEFLEVAIGTQVDHINHNKLDNCAPNLRRVSIQQNCMNPTKKKVQHML